MVAESCTLYLYKWSTKIVLFFSLRSARTRRPDESPRWKIRFWEILVFWFRFRVNKKWKVSFLRKMGWSNFCRGFWQGFGLDLLLVFFGLLMIQNQDLLSEFLHLVIMDFKCKVFCFGRFASKKLSNRYKVGPLPDVTWVITPITKVISPVT